MSIISQEPFPRTNVLFRDFARNVKRRARTNLTQSDSNVSKKLYNSIDGKYKANRRGGVVQFIFEEYGVYQDEGVKGWRSSSKAPDSPFQYKKKAAKPDAILGWVKARRFQFRDKKSGKFMSYASTAFLISRSIARDGMKPKKWFTEALQKYLTTFESRLEEVFARDLEDEILKDL
jgi:hypothetical protein